MFIVRSLCVVIYYITLAGEWWNANPIDVVNQATRTGATPNTSDAFTINGHPGDLYPCSTSGKNLFVWD